MFESLSGRLADVFEKLKRRGALSESDVSEAMRDVQVALLEADVALPVVREFIKKVRDEAVGQEVLRSVTPGQMVVKVVHDQLVEMLGAETEGLELLAPAPVGIMLVGLQGSGKTTTTAKIAARLQERDKKKVLMASLDTQRPAAQEQLKVLGEQASVATLPVVAGQRPVDIAKRAKDAARLGGYDVVMLDTAGRLQIDEALMAEAAAVRDAVDPYEILLVADAMTGQDAVNVAEGFKARLPLTGIVLTRVDGDARGGAALSMRAVTGCPIKVIGVGEKLDALEDFHPERIAGRILGMGDVVSLVEKAQGTIEEEEAEALAKKIQKGEFDLDDMAKQLSQMRKMGGLSGMMELLPGVAKAKKQMAEAEIDETALLRQEAIISSMTPKERQRPKLIHASRKKRIAKGSGTVIQDVNKLLKQYKTMRKMMKRMSKMGEKGLMRHGMQGLMPRM
ncbi:MAG: signal recognition particle protein [Pseudomonadota bacterium]|jgi:signal recognition particle subunit SRP54|nr:signal recognition particle protein [Pseudomonadota bacterium]